jgi:putative hydrolase of the HAD superfamily
MKKKTKITTLFLDVGGVMLTNGWDTHSRELAAKTFDLDLKEIEKRHHLTFDTYERGKISLEEYLKRVIFYKKRSFTSAQFQKFMFSQSQPFPEMLEMMKSLRKKYGLKIYVVSNEGRELMEYRIKKFKLGDFVDAFVASGFVHLCKPDEDIYRLALDIAQVPLDEILYIDDRGMLIEVAESLGIPGLQHIDYKTTLKQLAALGLKN